MSRTHKPIHVDGKLMTYDAIRYKFKVSYTTISHIIEQFGRDLPSSVFKPKNNIKPLPAIRSIAEDRTPGWAERKYFPDTGSRGFTGGKEHSPRTSVHCISRSSDQSSR